MPHQQVIALCIDGLRASALGAYGYTWRPTPAFDRVACDSFLLEWVLSETANPLDFYKRLFCGERPWERARLVTDCDQVVQLDTSDWFDEATPVDTPPPRTAADHIASTATAATFAAFAEAIGEEAADPGQGPKLLWLHCSGLGGPWDAPTELVNSFVDEDDPTPPPSLDPASGTVDRETDPDAIFAAACRYHAQVAVIDSCLQGLLEVIDATGAGEPPMFLLLGLRGYALGEHGVVGIDDAGPYSESRHVPFLIRPPQHHTGHRWGLRTVGLNELARATATLASPARSPQLPLLLDSPPSGPLLLQGAESTAVATNQWRLIMPKNNDNGRPELYVKPDDRWEANDVSSLRPDVVDDLTPDVTPEASS